MTTKNNNIEKNKTVFTCPKCDKEFSYNELFTHNEDIFNTLFEESVEKRLKEKEMSLIAEIEKDVKIREKEMENKFLQEKAELSSAYKVLENKLQESNKEYNITLEHNEKMHLQELKNLQQELENKFNKEHFQKINEQTKQMQELEISNKNLQKQIQLFTENNEKDIKAKIEILQKDAFINEKQLEEKLTKKLNDMEKEKAEIKNKLTQTENEKANAIVKLELETKVKLEEERKKYEERIKELEITNAQNRIINSKVKGENFENEAEGELRKAFGINDGIKKITTGDQKADYLMVVKGQDNQEMGRIVYELKNAKWSDVWEKKLVEDMAKEGGKYGVLVASSFNEKYKEVPFVRSSEFKNVWITDHLSFIFVGQILRKLVEVEFEYEKKVAALTADQKNEVLIEYEKTVNKLKEFMLSKLPVIISKLKKQYTDLERVSNSLIANSKTVSKSLEIIKTQIEKRIINELESISNINFNTVEVEESSENFSE